MNRSLFFNLIFPNQKGLKNIKIGKVQIDSRKGLEFKIDPWNYKTKLFQFKIFRRANSIRELFWRYKE